MCVYIIKENVKDGRARTDRQTRGRTHTCFGDDSVSCLSSFAYTVLPLLIVFIVHNKSTSLIHIGIPIFFFLFFFDACMCNAHVRRWVITVSLLLFFFFFIQFYFFCDCHACNL